MKASEDLKSLNQLKRPLSSSKAPPQVDKKPINIYEDE